MELKCPPALKPAVTASGNANQSSSNGSQPSTPIFLAPSLFGDGRLVSAWATSPSKFHHRLHPTLLTIACNCGLIFSPMGQSTALETARGASYRTQRRRRDSARPPNPSHLHFGSSVTLGLWLPHQSSMPHAGARKAVWIFALYLARPDHWTLGRCTMESFLHPPTEPKRELNHLGS